MKGAGKIGSALAAFEDNIAKNHEHFVGGRSFLTTIAANPSTPKKIHKSIVKRKTFTKKGGGGIRELQSSEHSIVDNSCSCHSNQSEDLGDEEICHTSCTTASTTDDSAVKSRQSLLYKSKIHGHTSHENPSAEVGAASSQSKDAATTQLSKFGQVGRSVTVSGDNSSFDQSNKMPLTNNGKIYLSENSPLHKIAATIRRVNKSNSFREAAKAAAKADLSSEGKSRTSKSIHGSKVKTATRLDDYVKQTTPMNHKKDFSESIAQCPDIPVTIIPIEISKISDEVASKQSPVGEEESITEVTVDNEQKKIRAGTKTCQTRTKLSDYVIKTSQSRKTVEKSVASLPITSVTTKSHLDDQSFASLPVLSPSRGIAVAARRSSINRSTFIIKKSHPSSPARTENGFCDVVIETSNYLNDDFNSVENGCRDIDMEYGPHNMSPSKLDSPNQKIESFQGQVCSDLPLDSSICESSAVSDGESLCGTEVTPTGIAKAARRSSVELMSRAEYDEIVSVSGITSISEESTTASWKTDDNDHNSTGDGNIRRCPQESSSLLSLDMYRHPQVIRHQNNRKSEDDLFESFSTFVGQSVFLPRRAEVVGILRVNSSLRNDTRHVRFADQQPGGGRRMSFHKSVKNDSLPVRPRRSNNFELDRLRNLRRKQQATETAEPFRFMSHLAATTIQACFRRWIQWKATRPVLLTRKLAWIEENHKRDLIRIQQDKWDKMEKIQLEIVEKERRLEAQVSLAEKLCDHLKRDSSIVQSQSKKMKEFSNILKINNNQLDQSVRLNRENYVTANLAVEFLREKSDTLLATSKKYASRIDKLQAELELTRKRVDIEQRHKVKTKKTLNRILRLLKNRGFDPTAKGTTHKPSVPIDLTNLDGKEFNVTLHSNETDMMSLCSDITNDSMTSQIMEVGHDEGCSNEINRATSSSAKSTAAFENSFATYDNQNIKRQLSMDSTSLAGNSFASYNAPDVSRKVVTIQNDTDHTQTSNNSGSYGAVVAPRRLPSSHSCFSVIEEVSACEESLDSDED